MVIEVTSCPGEHSVLTILRAHEHSAQPLLLLPVQRKFLQTETRLVANIYMEELEPRWWHLLWNCPQPLQEVEAFGDHITVPGPVHIMCLFCTGFYRRLSMNCISLLFCASFVTSSGMFLTSHPVFLNCTGASNWRTNLESARTVWPIVPPLIWRKKDALKMTEALTLKCTDRVHTWTRVLYKPWTSGHK